jgi:hypothetical protein
MPHGSISHTPSFLISTHYSRYNPAVFALNFLALVIVLIPKLPMVRSLETCLDAPS